MIELSIDTASEWLAKNHLPASYGHFSELGGGVSNVLILAELPGIRLVLKQSLGKLRVKADWRSDRDRIFRESAVMRWLQGKVGAGRIPRVLAEDRDNFAFAMEAAPPGAENWKSMLMRGLMELRHARSAGEILGSVISASWHHPEIGARFGDQTVFDQLRIDPYYRFTARRHPDLAGHFERLIANSSDRRVSLVHGDWSPKNLLAAGGELWAIDWEVAHFGDPGFDAGFLLNHLVLKSIAMPRHRGRLAELAGEFMTGLRSRVPADADWIERAALEHLPALLLARVDGKSPAEYLDGSMQHEARQRALALFAEPAQSVDEVFAQ